MNLKILAIGDLHIKFDNLKNIDLLTKNLIKIINLHKIENIVILGDILHHHEKLFTLELNKAIKLIKNLKELCFVYILVGNHDLINNQQFLTTNHWLNCLKEWENIKIIDRPFKVQINKINIVLVPYVYNGRLIEALNIIPNWKNVDLIFAHQEIKGAKMGSIISIDGDEWLKEYPLLISGHLHGKQFIKPNIYYTGSSLQNAFGESQKKTISIINIQDKNNINFDEISLNLPIKKIIYCDIKNLKNLKIDSKTNDSIKLTLKGSFIEFKSFKKTKKFENLIKSGIKINFKHKKIDEIKTKKFYKPNDFDKILKNMVYETKDNYIIKSYSNIIKEDILE